MSASEKPFEVAKMKKKELSQPKKKIFILYGIIFFV
jgi:hypothetical protein